MSLMENSIPGAAKKQYLYKLKTRTGLLLAMAALQVVALLFSLGGLEGRGMGSENITLSIQYFSGEMIIWFTFVWIFVAAILVTTRDYQNIDFTFVSNRLSSNLSNMGFLITAAITGGIAALSGGVLLRIIVYFTQSTSGLLSQDFFVTPRIFLTGIAVATLYLLLLGAIGYFCGVLVQLNKAFIILLPGAFLGSLILAARGNQAPAFIKAIEFFTNESSLALLALKVLLTVILLYAGAITLSNRLEVR